MSLLHHRSHKEQESSAAGMTAGVVVAEPSAEVAALLSELCSGGDVESRVRAARALGKSLVHGCAGWGVAGMMIWPAASPCD